jgi:hypothetical protein
MGASLRNHQSYFQWFQNHWTMTNLC